MNAPQPSSSLLLMPTHVIHQALHRQVTYAGAAPEFVMLEVGVIAALLFLVGVHVATVLLALTYATAGHSLAVWITARDPQMAAVYVRSLGAKDFYPPQAHPLAKSPAVPPSLAA